MNCVICVTSRYAPEAFATLSSATKMQTRGSLPNPLQYNIKYLDAAGVHLDTREAGAYTAAFVGCTYHCG